MAMHDALAVAGSGSFGDPQIARWRHGRQAAFVMMFDDGCPSHLERVVPALHERSLVGTFYLNPGAHWHDADGWQRVAATTAMELANHTLHHRGAENAAQAEEEIAACQRIVLALHPRRKIPRLLSFVYPGGTPWQVSEADKAAMLARHHLVVRPSTAGRVGGIHLKTGPELIQVMDDALAAHAAGTVSFHGVGGDWLSVDGDAFVALIDALAENRSRLWVTDPVALHKYEAERACARVAVREDASARRLSLHLECGLGELYDEPLTLSIPVPAAWASCRVSQGTATANLPVADGILHLDAVPDGPEIAVSPA
jgi:peptidoglycan/xylan/chitin deacetylase (PgdA/CDA1 family)